MAGTGEVYKGSDGVWGFRVKASTGEIIATQGGYGYTSKEDARATLQMLMEGDYAGPIYEVPTLVCGQEITDDTTLDSDLVCAPGVPPSWSPPTT